ncbi:hypothetical protein FOA52_001058 [Chlamydomonas sp. UWO 241]|nr:hypothetical protein FOA52_001058 [Chlamydomonas sp. UWO 241]
MGVRMVLLARAAAHGRSSGGSGDGGSVSSSGADPEDDSVPVEHGGQPSYGTPLVPRHSDVRGSGGGGGGGGGGGSDDSGGGSAGGGGDAQPPKYPAWMQAWFVATFLVYLYARTRWRADLKERADEYVREEAKDERSAAEWSTFAKAYAVPSGRPPET